MARDQYPSDEARRKSRPHVKVHLTTRTHRRTAEAWADPETRGMLLGLWQVAAEAFAGRTNGTVYLDRDNVAWITGRHRRDIALTSLQRLADIMEYSLEHRGEVVAITIRNFAEKQGFGSADRGVTTRTPPPSDSDSDTDTEKRSARGVKRRRKAVKTPDLFTRASVEALEPAYFEQLIADRPDLSEAVRTAAHARAWLLAVVPRMDAAGRYTDLRRTARSWFQNARQAEIVEAFDRAAKIAIRTAAASDAAQARADPAPEVSAEANAAVRRFMAQATRRMEKPT